LSSLSRGGLERLHLRTDHPGHHRHLTDGANRQRVRRALVRAYVLEEDERVVVVISGGNTKAVNFG
jgi:hypothetical protein